MQQHRSSVSIDNIYSAVYIIYGVSKERREQRREVHRQQARLIRQQEIDERRSQSLGLA